jgi:uncharacterized protein
MDSVIKQASAFVKEYMSHYDASHDFSHIQRVLHLAKTIEASERKKNPGLELNSSVITLSALLHDVGDRKYLKPGEDASTLVLNFLQQNECPKDIAEKVQLICTNVSYTNEVRNPIAVAQLCEEIPELKIVQDADRIDAIGAVGIARMFIYTGAKQSSRGVSVEHFHEKLLHIEQRIKTESGKGLARERTKRMEVYLGWWDDEVAALDGAKDAKEMLDGYTAWVQGGA